jgi:hypothetical protein
VGANIGPDEEIGREIKVRLEMDALIAHFTVRSIYGEEGQETYGPATVTTRSMDPRTSEGRKTLMVLGSMGSFRSADEEHDICVQHMTTNQVGLEAQRDQLWARMRDMRQLIATAADGIGPPLTQRVVRMLCDCIMSELVMREIATQAPVPEASE